MIEIRYLQAESGANKFGTCNCCGKSSGEDPLMISVKFSYYGHGTLICLCDDCKKKLMEALLPVNNSEIPNSSDTISRKAAIDALHMHLMYRMGTDSNKKRLDDWINGVPSAPTTEIATDINVGDKDIISRKAAIDEIERWLGYIDDDMVRRMQIGMKRLPPAQPERIKGHWIAMEKKNLFRCSECGAVIYSESEYDRNEFHKFCGRCGAKMEVTI